MAYRGPPIELRDVVEDDWSFIKSSWKKSLRDNNPAEGWVRAGDWFHEMEGRIDRLARRGRLVVACDKTEPDRIHGWALTEGNACHFVYVRHPYRNQGLAALMLGKLAAPVQCSHWSVWCNYILNKKPGVLVYDPQGLKKVSQ